MAIHAFIEAYLVAQVYTMAFQAIHFLVIPFAQYLVTEPMEYYFAELTADLINFPLAVLLPSFIHNPKNLSK